MSEPAEPRHETERHAAARFLLKQARNEGLELEDLIALRDSGDVGQRVTVAEYAAEVRKSYSASSLRNYDTYFRHLVEGLPWMCGCLCDLCIGVYGRTVATDEGRVPVPCPCEGGDCACPAAAVAESGADSCAGRWQGLGERTLASLAAVDIEQAMRWAQLRGRKHWAARNRKRLAKGRARHPHDGREAAAHTYNVARAIVRRAMADPSTGLTADIMAPIDRVRRKPQKARAYTPTQLAELWHAIFTTGSDDADLDMLLVWYHLEVGARRKGAIELQLGHLSFHTQQVLLIEKYDDDAWQPVSRELLLAIVGQALARGGDIVEATVDGLAPDAVTAEDVAQGRARLRGDCPVFYYRRKRQVTDASGHTRRAPWPLTARRYNTLFDRLQTALPWADEVGARPHDLRRTGATFIERAFGHAVARGWLRHRSGNQTDGYVLAAQQEVARAVEWLTGSPHPGTGADQPDDH